MKQKGISRVFLTKGALDYSVSGSLLAADGTLLKSSTISGQLRSDNTNHLDGEALQISSGHLRSEVTRTIRVEQSALYPSSPQTSSITESSTYPYQVYCDNGEDSKTFQILGKVNYSRQQGIQVRTVPSALFLLQSKHGPISAVPAVPHGDRHTSEKLWSAQWTSAIHSHAIYNRSLDNHTLYYKMNDKSHAEFNVSNSISGPANCYSDRVNAKGGYVVHDKKYPLDVPSNCHWPQNVWFCGSGLCRHAHNMLECNSSTHSVPNIPNITASMQQPKNKKHHGGILGRVNQGLRNKGLVHTL